jgi:hypothetical protein
MRLIITVLHIQQVTLYTGVKVDGEVKLKPALNSQLPSCSEVAFSACAEWCSCHVTLKFISLKIQTLSSSSVNFKGYMYPVGTLDVLTDYPSGSVATYVLV